LGLWNFADDEGRHPYSTKQCKAEVFPADPFSLEEIEQMLAELEANGLIAYYAVDGKEYFYITGWHHQRIDKPQKPKYPDPFSEHSTNIPRTIPPDRKGKERKGRDSREEGARPRSVFKKPTIDEVQEYCTERNSTVNPEAFIDHYEANGWRVGRNPMKDWKAAVRTWEKRDEEDQRNRRKGSGESTAEFAQRMARYAASGPS
jgi:hypothetical protein